MVSQAVSARYLHPTYFVCLLGSRHVQVLFLGISLVLYIGFNHPNRRVYHRVVGGIVLATIASFVLHTVHTKIVVLPIVSVLTWAVLRSRPQIDQRVQRICVK